MAETDELLKQVNRVARVSEQDFYRPFDPSLAALMNVDSAPAASDARQLRRVMVAVDMSDCSHAALDYALVLARQTEPRAVFVLHVVGPETMRQSIKKRYPFAPRTTEGPVQLDDRELIDLVAEERERSYASLQCFVPPAAATLRIQLQVLIGDPVACIVEAAGRHKADLLVVGTHGRTGLQRVVMGSVAEQVVRSAPCAVLTVKV